MPRVGNIVTMQKGTYKDRLGIIIKAHDKILFDVKLAPPGERRSEINLNSPGVVITNCLEIEDFYVGR